MQCIIIGVKFIKISVQHSVNWCALIFDNVIVIQAMTSYNVHVYPLQNVNALFVYSDLSTQVTYFL